MATLDFTQFIGGTDTIQTEVTFPSSQRTVTYNFGQDITGWTFRAEHQTVIADTIAYDRTGAPNFSNTKIIGTFPAGTINGFDYIQVLDYTNGIVAVTIPGGLYTGPIIPDARAHTPITLIGFTWTSNSTPPQIQTHRWALIQTFDPSVTAGDPVLDPDYTSITVGA